MWPFWHHVSYFYEGASGEGFILFPLVGHMELENQETWWFVPPLFRVTKGEEQDLVYFPWPIFQYGSGKIDKLYFWPLWGHKTMGHVESSFFLWPLGRRVHVDDELKTRDIFRLVPLYYADVLREKGEKEGEETLVSRYHKLWPLMSYRREGNAVRFRMLDLWPLKNGAPIERNLAPFWTLYDQVSVDGDKDVELLWGLYRSHKRGETLRKRSLFPFMDTWRDDSAAEKRGWSILKGLIGYERDKVHKELRLLYILRIGKKEANP